MNNNDLIVTFNFSELQRTLEALAALELQTFTAQFEKHANRQKELDLANLFAGIDSKIYS